MKAWAHADYIEQAAIEVGVRAVNMRKDGRANRFVIRTSGPTTDGKDVVYGRRSGSVVNKDGQYRRVPGAVCWHGHRDFFRALYRLVPDAKIITALAIYRDSDDFEATYRDTRYQERDYYGFHVPYVETCDCS